MKRSSWRWPSQFQHPWQKVSAAKTCSYAHALYDSIFEGLDILVYLYHTMTFPNTAEAIVWSKIFLLATKQRLVA
jgi:hypothetical protein